VRYNRLFMLADAFVLFIALAVTLIAPEHTREIWAAVVGLAILGAVCGMLARVKHKLAPYAVTAAYLAVAGFLLFPDAGRLIAMTVIVCLQLGWVSHKLSGDPDAM